MNTPKTNYVPQNMRKLFVQIEIALQSWQGVRPSTYDMMAICWLKTLGNFFYDCKDCLYKRRLVELEQVTGLKSWEFLNELKCPKGINSGKTPRFVFDAAAFQILTKDPRTQNLSKLSAAILASGIGVASRFHSIEAFTEDHESLLEFVRNFKRDESMQLQMLAYDMVLYGFTSESGLVSAFSAFERRRQPDGFETTFGRRAAALSLEYETLMTAEDSRVSAPGR